MRIHREPLRAAVRRTLLQQLREGTLRPGANLNESQLAQQLGVSRTPLREALLSLQFEGFVESAQGRGFSVAPLRAKTARDLHSLVGMLESVAARALADLEPDAYARVLEGMEAINADLSAPADPESNGAERVIERGDQWHALLVSGSNNEQLHEMLQILKGRLFRYTYHYVAGPDRIACTRIWHEQILGALREREFDRAAELVQEHWMTGADAQYEWCDESPPHNATSVEP